MGWIDSLEPHWFWLALGLFLAAAEMAIPGVFLIWLAGAALVTGLVTWVLPIGLPLQVVMFGALAIVAVFAGRRYLKANPVVSADPQMNRRGARLVGEWAKVSQPIENGQGKIHVGDTEWLARGLDAPLGARVRIVGSDGAVLLVEPIEEASAARPQLT